MRVWSVSLLVALAACGATSETDDAGVADDATDCRFPVGGHQLGWLPEAGDCAPCAPGDAGNFECQQEYDVPAACVAYCEDAATCARFCEGECRYGASDNGTCTPGTTDCLRAGLPAICEPACGDPGGCRFCYSDDECEALLGAGAKCKHHCGVCCVPDEPSSFPCSACS